MNPAERLIIALDYRSGDDALRAVERLGDSAGYYKVGIGLFAAEGPEIVRELRRRGKRVFVDLKFHDIPAQVDLACRAVVRLGAQLMNLHSVGGSQVMQAACAAVADEAARIGVERPLVIGVTLLTSLEGIDDAWGRMRGADAEVAEMVLTMTRLVLEAGLDGVVCSGQEVGAVKEAFGSRCVTVVPGIRPAGSSLDDQRRVLTPEAAVREGADYLVVGRPITGAPDPVAAMEAIVHEMGRAALPRPTP